MLNNLLSADQQENVDNMCAAFDLTTRKLNDGEPCSRTCERHVTHRCEKCGRYAAHGEITVFVPEYWAHKPEHRNK